MKISDLTEKGPIIGAPKGSQKDARLTPGTDDPSKYMRGGEWEAYREPQGVSSDAGKIAGGTKKGTTKTKNKKTSEGLGDMFKSSPEEKELRRFKNDPDRELERGNGYLNSSISDAQEQGHEELADKLRDIRLAFARHMNRGQFRNAISMLNHAGTLRHKAAFGEAAILPAGGPGSSGDLVPRHRDATTINMTRNSDPKIGNNKAPIKQARAKVKKSLTDTPGNTKAVNESVPRLSPRQYDADYTLRDDKDTEDLGEARVRQGVIELLAVRNDFAEDFNGHVMSRLLSTIVQDADLANANLAIQLDDASDIQHKRFMERFGFRETQNGVMKRNAGSVRPPSVPTARL